MLVELQRLYFHNESSKQVDIKTTRFFVELQWRDQIRALAIIIVLRWLSSLLIFTPVFFKYVKACPQQIASLRYRRTLEIIRDLSFRNPFRCFHLEEKGHSTSTK